MTKLTQKKAEIVQFQIYQLIIIFFFIQNQEYNKEKNLKLITENKSRWIWLNLNPIASLAFRAK